MNETARLSTPSNQQVSMKNKAGRDNGSKSNKRLKKEILNKESIATDLDLKNG
jgi:hypothetical protein